MGMWQSLVSGYDDNFVALQKDEFYIGSTKKGRGQDKVLDAIVFVLDNQARLKEIKRYGYGDESVPLLVSESSESRTVAPVPHCMFDTLEYVCGEGRKHELWKTLLLSFGTFSSVPQVKTVCEYVLKGTLARDVGQSGIVAKTKTLVLFEVMREDAVEFRLWKMPEVYASWVDFILKGKNEHVLDCMTGTRLARAESHPKKISNSAGNAKLISSNDAVNFTYRGRLVDADQVVSIGYESTQKAHQFLRYLISTRGIRCGSQVIVTWTSGASKEAANLLPPVEDEVLELYDELSETTTDSSQLAARTGIVFSDALRDAIIRGKYSELLEKHQRTSVLILDAATDGRMSVVLYRELETGEYLERIAQWHESAAWQLMYKKPDVGKQKCEWHRYVGAPSVDSIMMAVYGKAKSGKDEGYLKNKMAVREEMIHVIFDGAGIPSDYLSTIFCRLTRPLSFKSKEGFDRFHYSQTLSVYCSLFKRDYQQRNKEFVEMKLEQNRRDRSYLYGRLLGAADKLEEYALRKSGAEKRETAAMRYMQAFAQRPFTTWETIHRTLVPYVQKVKGSVAQKEIETVHALFSGEDFRDDKALDGFYLLGYYHELDYINDRVAELKQQKMNDNN